MLNRRLILDRDPPVNWPATFTAIRLQGFGTAEICFTLNIERDLLAKWEKGVQNPNFENGRAVLKLLEYVNSVAKRQPRIASIAA